MKKKRSYTAVCLTCGTERKTSFNLPARQTVLRCNQCGTLTTHMLKTDVEEEW